MAFSRRDSFKPKPKKPEPPLIPRFYWYRGRYGSDRGQLETWMLHIPENERPAIALEYEHIFMATHPRQRAKANDFLFNKAQEYWAQSQETKHV